MPSGYFESSRLLVASCGNGRIARIAETIMGSVASRPDSLPSNCSPSRQNDKKSMEEHQRIIDAIKRATVRGGQSRSRLPDACPRQAEK
jgi:DNA-binding GntR family transcriptional regulator